MVRIYNVDNKSAVLCLHNLRDNQQEQNDEGDDQIQLPTAFIFEFPESVKGMHNQIERIFAAALLFNGGNLLPPFPFPVLADAQAKTNNQYKKPVMIHWKYARSTSLR